MFPCFPVLFPWRFREELLQTQHLAGLGLYVFLNPESCFCLILMRLVLRNLPPVKKVTELLGRMRPQTFAAAPGGERLRACTVALFNLPAAPQTSWHQNLPRWQNSAAPGLRKSSGYSASAAGTAAKQQRQSAFECHQTWVSALKAEEGNARRTIWVLAGRLAPGPGSMPACTDPLGHHRLLLSKKVLGHFKKIWSQDVWSSNI